MHRAEANPARGLLHTSPVPGQHRRLLPAPDLAGLVEHFWFVSWELGEAAPRIVETLPHPSVHIVFEHGVAAEIAGIHRGRFTRVLAGNSKVFGIKFRPGGFYPFWQKSIADLIDRRMPLADAMGDAGAAFARNIERESDDERRMQLAEQFLRARLPNPRGHLSDERSIVLIDQIVACVIADRSITKVEQLTTLFSCHARTLQRIFQHYVGISPKWLIQRYRLHEAVEQLKQGDRAEWSQLALQLGYSDQAHFIRDFKTLVGKTPLEYAQSLAAQQG